MLFSDLLFFGLCIPICAHDQNNLLKTLASGQCKRFIGQIYGRDICPIKEIYKDIRVNPDETYTQMEVNMDEKYIQIAQYLNQTYM